MNIDLKNRISKIKYFRVEQLKSLISKAFRVLKEKGLKKFVVSCYKYILYGRSYFKSDDSKSSESKNNKINEDSEKSFNKFFFKDSSITWYGIAKQLEKQLIRLGYQPDKDGVSICYANDLGEIDPSTLKPANPENRTTLNKFMKSKADYIFYSQKTCSKWFRNKKNSFYLPSGVDIDIFRTYPEVIRNIDVGFVGKDYGLPIRNDFISKLKEKENKFNFVVPKEGDLFFEKLARFYSRCKVVVNDSQQGEITMRMFEATACGCLLVTKRVPYIEEIFDIGEEIIVYDNLDEMIEKINYYLKNDKEREDIARRGQRKTRLVHSYYDRAKSIANAVRGERKEDFMKSAELYKKLYKDYSETMPKAQERLFDDSLPDTNMKWNIRERMRKTISLCRGDILDVGTQRGGYLFHAKKLPQVKKVVGIDISEDYINDAKKMQPDVEFLVGKIESLPFPDKSFDTVIVTEILEHIPGLMKGINEAKRVMNDDGQILVSVPDYDYEEDPYHVRNFTRFDFTQLFEGMKVEFVDLDNCSNILVKVTNRN